MNTWGSHTHRAAARNMFHTLSNWHVNMSIQKYQSPFPASASFRKSQKARRRLKHQYSRLAPTMHSFIHIIKLNWSWIGSSRLQVARTTASDEWEAKMPYHTLLWFRCILIISAPSAACTQARNGFASSRKHLLPTFNTHYV